MDNPLFFLMLLIGGGVLMSVLAIACHRWSTRLILRGRHLLLRLCVPVLLTGLFFIIPPVLAVLYSIFFGYRLEADEAAGPMGDPGGLMLLLWPYGVLLLVVYAVAAFFRPLDRPKAP